MKKKTVVLLVILIALLCSAAYAACSMSYRATCDGCSHATRTFRCVGHTNQHSVTVQCPRDAACRITKTYVTHIMKCTQCGYGGGAYNLEDRLISQTHSKCGGDVVINSACPGD